MPPPIRGCWGWGHSGGPPGVPGPVPSMVGDSPELPRVCHLLMPAPDTDRTSTQTQSDGKEGNSNC